MDIWNCQVNVFELLPQSKMHSTDSNVPDTRLVKVDKSNGFEW